MKKIIPVVAAILLFSIAAFAASQRSVKNDYVEGSEGELRSQERRERLIKSQKVVPKIGEPTWDSKTGELLFYIRFKYIKGIEVSMSSKDSVEVIVADTGSNTYLCAMAVCEMPKDAVQVDKSDVYVLPKRPCVVIARLAVKGKMTSDGAEHSHVSMISWKPNGINNIRIF